MNKYREYFIGGPLDGRDKAGEFPRIPEWGMVRAIDFTGEAIVTHDDNVIRELNIEWSYSRDYFVFGGLRVPFWTDSRYMSREMISCRLAELIMEPHIDHRPEPCVCTDSVHSASGFCPSETDSEYNMCPRRRLTESEIIRQSNGQKVNLVKGAKP